MVTIDFGEKRLAGRSIIPSNNSGAIVPLSLMIASANNFVLVFHPLRAYITKAAFCQTTPIYGILNDQKQSSNAPESRSIAQQFPKKLSFKEIDGNAPNRLVVDLM